MTNTIFQLPTLSPWHKKKFLTYAEDVLLNQQKMTENKDKNILHYILEKKRRHIYMNHYPKGDRIDFKTGAQYFYHCHRENEETEEHGHFHCFIRYKFIPKQYKPMPLSDWDKYIDNPMTHLVAIAMNRYGQPIRLFSVNRWVTSEICYGAEYIEKFIARFNMTLTDKPYWQILDQWINGMIKLFSPQIIWLQQQRDQHIEQLKKQYENPFEEKEIEEISSINIDLEQQIQWVLQATPKPIKSQQSITQEQMISFT